MLTEQNIEQYLFDYHEGTLDASQKVELMDFLHQHPEWQRDFAIWAQVRLHDEPVAAPVLQKKILRSSVPQFALWSSGLLVVVGVAAISALLLWWNYRAPIAETSLSVSPPTRITLPPSRTPSPKSGSVAGSKITIHKKQNQKITPSEKPIRATLVLEEAPVLLTEDPQKTSEIFLPVDTVLEQTAPQKGIAAIPSPPDTSAVVERQETAKGAAPQKKKKRYKRKLSLKPTSDVVPSNSNF